MGNRFLQGIIITLGTFLLLYMGAHFVRETGATYRWSRAGVLGLVVNWGEDNRTGTVQSIREEVFPPGRAPQPGDTLLTVNGRPATRNNVNEFRFTAHKPGTPVEVSYVHRGREEQSIAILQPPSTGSILGRSMVQVVRYLTAIGYMLVALWAFSRRPDSGGVRAMTLFCFSMTALVITGIRVGLSAYSPFEIPFQEEISDFLGVLSSAFGAFWLNLMLLFPHPHKFVRRQPVPAYSLIYGPLAAILAMTMTDVIPPMWQGEVYMIMISIQVWSGFGIIYFRGKHARSTLEHRQISLVSSGSGIGLFLLFLLGILSSFATNWFRGIPELWRAFAITTAFLGLLISPISFAYAFGRYRLLEVEGTLKRGTRYLLANGILLAILIAIAYGIGEVLLRYMNIESRTVTLVFAMILALGVGRARGRLERVVERRFFPDRFHRRRMVEDIGDTLMTTAEAEALWERLEQLMREAFTVQRIVPVMLREEEGFVHTDGEFTPILPEGSLHKWLRDHKTPLLVDEAIDSRQVQMTPDEASWLMRQDIALLLPLMVNRQLKGFIGFGPRAEKEDFSHEDIKALTSLAPQISLAVENIRLVQDNLEKRRMEEQLSVARGIQQGFLPRHLPDTPGLEVAANSRFCFEVAGDYYDVIRLPDGRTALAVGDVSGKGAGAAMIMANLQASLRTALRLGDQLSTIVAGINDLIHQNTPPEQYVTFFVAVYDHESMKLAYVNAGHNPPCILRANGETIELTEGGMILGALPGVIYEEGEVKLWTGDLLVAYTDGVSEAMNEREEEFGDARIFESVRLRLEDPPAQLMEALEQEVHTHIGDTPLGDDFTLLLARVTSDAGLSTVAVEQQGERQS